MGQMTWKKSGYMFGIGLGIIFVTAFLFSQIVFPMILGRPSVVETPDVVGMGLVQAKRILQAEKLHVVVKDSLYSETAKLDQVMEQSPKPGIELKEDGTVFLVVSKGSKMVNVPNLIGYSYQEALITLRNYDLRFSVVDSLNSDSEPRNTVMRSTPMGGSKVEKRTTVKLTLSKGPESAPDSTYFDIYDHYDY